MKDKHIINTLCETWTDVEVEEACSLICTEAQKRRNTKGLYNKVNLVEGSRVSWKNNHGYITKGEVIRVKRKKALVGEYAVGTTQTVQTWDIPINLLTIID